MLPSLSGVLRLALVVSLGSGMVAVWDSAAQRQLAFAQEGEDEEDDGGDDEGGDDEGGGDEEGEDEDGDDKDQPAVTAGGLYTIKTFPIRENERPLTITQKITQVRLSVGADLSNEGAFQSFGANIEALHGVSDNFMLLGGFTNAYYLAQFTAYAGFEGALAYDLIDFRLAARAGRAAIPNYEDVDDGMGGTIQQPNGEYDKGETKFAVDIGFPFRYVARPEIAIVALQTLMSIDFNGTNCVTVGEEEECDNSVTPDFNPSLAIVTNPIAALSLVVQAQMQVKDFNFNKKLSVPATIRAQFSPKRTLDIGLEFTLLNIKPVDPDDDGPIEEPGPFDNRYLSIFMAGRFGK